MLYPRRFPSGLGTKLTVLLGANCRPADGQSLRSFISFDTATYKYGTFTADDLHIGALMNLGNLRIRWTMKAEDHLLLVMGGTRDDDASSVCSGVSPREDAPPREDDGQNDTLLLYWFNTVELAWLAA